MSVFRRRSLRLRFLVFQRSLVLVRPPGDPNRYPRHFQRLAEVDATSFTEMIDLWVLEFAELYAAKQ